MGLETIRRHPLVCHPAAANVDRIVTKDVSYKTTTSFNVAALAVTAILAPLHATWW